MNETIETLKNKIAELEYLQLHYIEEKPKQKNNAFVLGSITAWKGMNEETLEFLYTLLKQLDKEWDGKTFFEEPKYNKYKI